MIEIISTPTRDIVEQLTELYIATFSAPPRNEEIDQAAIRLLMEKEIEEGEVRVIFDDSTQQLIGSLSLVQSRILKIRRALILRQAYIFRTLWLMRIFAAKELASNYYKTP